MSASGAALDSALDAAVEVASGFTVGRYCQLRSALEPTTPGSPEWDEVIAALRRRIDERFLQPVRVLLERRQEHVVPGFAALALDCLLIDTIQSFREGRTSTGEVSPARSFRDFLRAAPFSDFNNEDRSSFFHYVRNALLHNGETRGDWRVRADGPAMLTKRGRTRIINRTLFHSAIESEFTKYCQELANGPADVREKFLRRMNSICGVVAPPHKLYFAYASNLSGEEVDRRIGQTASEGVAFLPGYRLAFTKHSQTWGGDAATIEPAPTSVVWGFVYRVTPQQHQALAAREGGYKQTSLTVWRVGDTPDCQESTPEAVATFVAESPCERVCGPPAAYVDVVLAGARERGLPAQYIEVVAKAAGR